MRGLFGCLQVDMSLRVLRVAEIDAVTQTFTVECVVLSEWCNPALIGLDGAEGARRCREWMPRIAIKNLVRSHVVSD